MVPGTVPKRFLAAAERPIMPWDFSLAKLMIPSQSSSQPVTTALLQIFASGSRISRVEKSRFSSAFRLSMPVTS